MRTILQIAQDAAPKIGIDVPGLLVGSTDRTEVELLSVLNELVDRIARLHDWRALKALATYTGDGTTEEFDLPGDYLRMPKDAQVWSTRWQRPLLPITPEDALRLDIREYDLVAGTWFLVGDQMVFRPALASGELAKWYYIAATQVKPANGANKARITLDTDTFRLGDRLLELHLIWEWRQRKGLSYAEDMATAEVALAQAISEDKGARIITQSSRMNSRAKIAYPWSVEP